MWKMQILSSNFLSIFYVIIKPYEIFCFTKTTLLRLGKFTHVFFQTREISFPVHKYVFMHINDVIAYNTNKIKMENDSGKNDVFFYNPVKKERKKK